MPAKTRPATATSNRLAIALVVLGPLSLLLIRWTRPVLGFVSRSRSFTWCGTTRTGPCWRAWPSPRSSPWCSDIGSPLAGLGTVRLVAASRCCATLQDRPWNSVASGVIAWSLLIRRSASCYGPPRADPGARRARADGRRGQRGATADRPRAARRRRAPHLADQRAGRSRAAHGRSQARAGGDGSPGDQGCEQGGAGGAALVGRHPARCRRRAPRKPSGTLASLDDLVERSRHAGLDGAQAVPGDVRALPSSVELAALAHRPGSHHQRRTPRRRDHAPTSPSTTAPSRCGDRHRQRHWVHRRGTPTAPESSACANAQRPSAAHLTVGAAASSAAPACTHHCP